MLLKLDSLPKDMMGVMLQLTVFVESANKGDVAFLQQTVNCWIFSLLPLPLLQSTRLVLKEWSPMLFVLSMYNKGCLFLIIYKVHIGDVRIDFSHFPFMSFLVTAASSSWQWCTLSSSQWHMHAIIMMLFVDDDFNTGYLPIIIYQLLIGNNV